MLFKPPDDAIVIDTTSRSKNWSVGLSPFLCGPIGLYGNYAAWNVENGWQYSKTYLQHADDKGDPTQEYFKWAEAGWKSKKAVRYPMGRGAKPLYSYWDGKKLGYVEARKQIYIPLYSKAVKRTDAFKRLKDLYLHMNSNDILYLKDFDSHSLDPGTFDYWDLWNNDKIKVGHGYVLAMLLEGIL